MTLTISGPIPVACPTIEPWTFAEIQRDREAAGKENDPGGVFERGVGAAIIALEPGPYWARSIHGDVMLMPDHLGQQLILPVAQVWPAVNGCARWIVTWVRTPPEAQASR